MNPATPTSSAPSAAYDPNSGTAPTAPTLQDPTQYYNDPSVGAAQNAVTSAQTQAGASQAGDQALPAMLSAALAPKLMDAQDPNNIQAKGNLSKYLGDLGNPMGIVNSATSGNNAVLSPSQMSQIISGRLGNEAGQVSMDNLVAGARYGGLANVIGMTAATHAANTQALMQQAQIAQTTYQNLLTKVQQESQAAIALNEAKNAMYGTNMGAYSAITGAKIGANATLGAALIGQNTAFQTNPAYLATQEQQKATSDARSMNKQEFISTYGSDPNISPDIASRAWNDAHPNDPINIGLKQKEQAVTSAVPSTSQNPIQSAGSSILNFLFPELGVINRTLGSLPQGGSSSQPPLSSFVGQ